jgi:glycosyltransferase involved in cell wall biosynthesis
MRASLAAKTRYWRVKHFESRLAKKHAKEKSIAMGFAWRAANIGGVRRHLECIEKYSSSPVAVYPSTYAGEVLKDGVERNHYHLGLGEELIKRHAILHSHVDPHFIGLAQRASEQGKPWVHTYHALYFADDWGGELEDWQQKINDCLINEAKKADVCLAVNSWLVEWLKTDHEISSVYLPNGVDVEACDSASREAFTKRYGIDNFVLFVGSISSIKNPLAFIGAATKSPERAFVVIGTGLTRQGIETGLGIQVPPNLEPLGPLPHDETLDAIAACSAFVMTSHREGLPTVLLEAMAMQKPCVVPDAPWFVDAIPTEVFGLKYSPGDLDDLAAKIEDALGLGQVKAARERVEENFAWSVVAAQLDEIYARLLRAPSQFTSAKECLIGKVAR